MTETNERFVYLVPSDRRPGKSYRVDLVANDGAGWCQCTDFGTRRQPAIDAGAEHGTRDTLCKHLLKARRHFLNGVLKALAKQEREPVDAR